MNVLPLCIFFIRLVKEATNFFTLAISKGIAIGY